MNSEELQCTYAGLSPALISYNVGRAFLTIGSGGVGQSMFANLIDSAMSPKTWIPGHIGSLYWRRTQEATSSSDAIPRMGSAGSCGGRGGAKGTLSGFIQKMMSADKMMARLPYAMLTKLISMKGMKRFELNRVLRFVNISEQTFDSIYRRSLVINLQAKFTPEAEYRSLPESDAAASGVFAKAGSLKSFLSSPPAGAAFLQILFSFMSRNSASQCAERIDTYARTEGTTWQVMRFARNLPTSRPDFKISGEIFDPALDEKARLIQLIDALALEALPKNIDVSACSLQDLSTSLQSPHPIAWPRCKEESKKFSTIW